MTVSELLTAVVIVVENSPNVEQIQKFLIAEQNIPTFVIKGVTPKDLECSGLCKSRTDFQEYHFGLTCIEAAISKSHSNARAFLLDTRSAWGAVFEDDIQFSDSFDAVFRNINKLTLESSHKKIGIHLVPRQFGLLLKNKSNEMLSVLMLPDCAAGYILNQNALKYAVAAATNRVYLADWPPYLRKIRWYAFTTAPVIHPDLRDYRTQSSTSGQRLLRQAYQLKSVFVSRQRIRYLVFKLLSLFGRSYDQIPLVNENLKSAVIPSFRRNV
jgi:GR25 family glycosyltransferase involved in LPS biosynthesis